MDQDLLDGKWLSATLIEAYISCNKKSNKTLIIPDSIGQKIILSGQFHSKNKRIFLNKVDFNAYESIISFINIGGHWNLMYASKTGTFIYFDPYGNNKSRNTEFLKNWGCLGVNKIIS
ncbi:hypothetical protein BpHYR1_007298 [Brachionus plicatilis]|uniref:Ubiquitin-like protease family profile domain-containing protein n=1 Tax=Brachionus plicatilis TaxID=10195 RepID=A0A3M7PDB3_BRAPC|nr:hypothetical protein BpHYR1_007298 [Brachionus plicatilis]